MRGDRVGVGDVGTVHDGKSGDKRNRRYLGDGRDAGREHDCGILYGHREHEQCISKQQRRNRIDIGDGAWGEHGASDVHGQG